MMIKIYIVKNMEVILNMFTQQRIYVYIFIRLIPNILGIYVTIRLIAFITLIKVTNIKTK